MSLFNCLINSIGFVGDNVYIFSGQVRNLFLGLLHSCLPFQDMSVTQDTSNRDVHI